MSVEEVIALLRACLKDDIIGMIATENNVLTLSFTDGTERTITVT